MDICANSEQIVSDVAVHSPAERCGIVRGDVLLAINGAPVIDLVDYEFLTAESRLTVQLRGADGVQRTAQIEKDEAEPLGLSFATTMMDALRTCKNHCCFCFIDQMPQGTRTSLHVKDDDWRMSFIMGNYVSLTNVDDAELDRIIQRRVSPLYVSLHATDPIVRVSIMCNPNAGRILEQLRKLCDAGIRFHLQVVLCPGVNDGDVLARTLSDAAALAPCARTLAIVPVGLTRFRERLFPLRTFTSDEARAMIASIEAFQSRCLARMGTRFAFLSDEWYLLAGLPLPPFDAYEDFEQIENGVGLLRLFEDEFNMALARCKPLAQEKRVLVAGGTAAAPFFGKLLQSLARYRCIAEPVAIENRYFGGNVSVGGLVTGGDLVEQLRGRIDGRALLIPRNMLRERGDVFLDGLSLAQAEQALGARMIPFGSGEDFIDMIFGGETA